MKSFFQKTKMKLKRIGERMISKPRVGSLQVTDSSVQYLLLEGDFIRTFALRLPYGTVQDGKIQDVTQFTGIVQKLHQMVMPGEEDHIIPVVFLLPASTVFTQTFRVPATHIKDIQEVSDLNLQMISPIPSQKAYMSSELIREDQDFFEFLGAVVEKGVVDSFSSVLEATNFYPVAFEFPALSLTRIPILNQSDASQPSMFINVSSDGLGLSIVRGGKLFFDYFHSWKSLQGEERQILRSSFESAVRENVQKVLNFSLSHFHESITQAYLIAPGFELPLQELITNTFHITVWPVSLPYALDPIWFVALGSSIRGTWDRSKDNAVSLGGQRSSSLYYEQQLVDFIRVWRNIVIGVGSFLLLCFLWSAIFLGRQDKILLSQTQGFESPSYISEFQSLQRLAQDFNLRIASIASVRQGDRTFLYQYFEDFYALALSHGVAFQSFGLSSSEQSFSMQLRAPSSGAVLRFKNALIEHPHFQNVNLPISSVVTQEDGSVSFQVSFQLEPLKK